MKKLSKKEIDNLIHTIGLQTLRNPQVYDLHKIINKKGTPKIIAEYINRTERRVLQMTDENIIKRETNKKYNLIKSVHKFIEYEMGKYNMANLPSARKRLEAAKAEREELKLSTEKGESIDVGDAMFAYGKVVQSHRARMLSIPKKTAPLMVGCKNISEAEDILKRIVYEALNELADPDLINTALDIQKRKRQKSKKRKRQ